MPLVNEKVGFSHLLLYFLLIVVKFTTYFVIYLLTMQTLDESIRQMFLYLVIKLKKQQQQ